MNAKCYLNLIFCEILFTNFIMKVMTNLTIQINIIPIRAYLSQPFVHQKHSDIPKTNSFILGCYKNLHFQSFWTIFKSCICPSISKIDCFRLGMLHAYAIKNFLFLQLFPKWIILNYGYVTGIWIWELFLSIWIPHFLVLNGGIISKNIVYVCIFFAASDMLMISSLLTILTPDCLINFLFLGIYQGFIQFIRKVPISWLAPF